MNPHTLILNTLFNQSIIHVHDIWLLLKVQYLTHHGMYTYSVDPVTKKINHRELRFKQMTHKHTNTPARHGDCAALYRSIYRVSNQSGTRSIELINKSVSTN